jgi:hypothetical protein
VIPRTPSVAFRAWRPRVGSSRSRACACRKY